jgi:hypothetical protein
MDKVVASAAQAIADIQPGASVAIAGFGLAHRFPNNLIFALRDKGTTDLTLVCNSLGAAGEKGQLLVENNQVKKLVAAFSIRAGMQTEGDDVAGSTSTLASLSTLPSNPGMLEQVNYSGDQDWYKVSLTSGHTYKLSLAQAATSVVPDQNLTLQLLDASGSNVVISLDSTGTGTTLPIGVSNYLVTPSVSGTYYVDVSGVVSKTAPGFYYVSVNDKSIADASNTYQINALSFSTVEGASGSSPYVFDVTRDNSANSASINWSLVGTGTNPSDASDFTGSLSGTVNFGVGENEQRITVYVSGDTS